MIPCSPPIPGALYAGKLDKGRALLVGWVREQNGEYQAILFTAGTHARRLARGESFIPDDLLPPEVLPEPATVRVVHRADDGLWKTHA